MLLTGNEPSAVHIMKQTAFIKATMTIKKKPDPLMGLEKVRWVPPFRSNHLRAVNKMMNRPFKDCQGPDMHVSELSRPLSRRLDPYFVCVCVCL